MRGYLHYNIWNKANNIPHILRSINYFVPLETILDFTFENCTDNSISVFNTYKDVFLNGYNIRVQEASHKYRMKNLNDAIQRYLQTDCDFILSPQDDQWIQDAFLFNNINNLISNENNIGIVGMRDGFTFDFKDYYSSNFSEKTHQHKKWLKSGEYQSVKCINDGALLLSRQTINTVGYFNESMNAFYIENDYCARCIKLGLQNYVMGAELVHIKLSAEKSELYDSDKNYGAKDLEILLTNHPDLYNI
jgi:hypothetical protein